MNPDNRIVLGDMTFSCKKPFAEIEKGISELAARLNADYACGPAPVFMPVLNGSFMFAAELLKNINFHCEVSFIKLSSYAGDASSGAVSELIGLGMDIAGRDVIVLEDIVETGLTIGAIDALLRLQNPRSIRYATLFFKPGCFAGYVSPDYRVFDVDYDFIVGFGLDYNGLGRNLKDVYTLVR